MTEAHILQVAFALTALCVVYKLAYLVRQVAALHQKASLPFRLLAAFLGTAIIVSIVEGVANSNLVTLKAVMMNLAWCGILAFIIVFIGRTRRVW